MIKAGSRVINIGIIYICVVDISSFTYFGLFSFIIPNTGIDEKIIIGVIGQGSGGSMSIGGALELIQSFINPKIIDAPDNSLQEAKLHSQWKLLTVLRDFLQLPKLFLKWWTNCSVVPLKLSSRTVLVTY